MNAEMKTLNETLKNMQKNLVAMGEQMEDVVNRIEIISVDKPEFKTEKRAAEIGDRILITNPEDDSAGAEGEVFTVTDVGSMGSVDVKEIMVNANHYAFVENEYEVITEPEQVPIIKEEPETIEHEGLLLQRVNRVCKDGDYVRVQHEDGKCFKPNKLYGPVRSGVVEADSSTEYNEFEKAEVYNEFYGRNEKTVEVFEIVEELVKELTPNEERAELIEKAKKFLEKNTRKKICIFNSVPCLYPYTVGLVEEFIVNEDKKTVVCLLRGVNSNIVRFRGIAKCMPGEVFNEWIGKAIALARALKIDVPEEFLNAVQPNKVVVGMDLAILWGSNNQPTGEVDRVVSFKSEGIPTYADGMISTHHKIINDTNAEYSQ